MNTYEALIVFKPFVDADNTDNALKPVEKAIKSAEGKITKTEKLGRKRLAYEINKFKDGFLVTFLLEMPAEGVEKFRKACQLNDDILRLTILKLDETALTAVTTVRPREERPEREERGGGREFRGPRRGGDRGRFDR